MAFVDYQDRTVSLGGLLLGSFAALGTIRLELLAYFVASFFFAFLNQIPGLTNFDGFEGIQTVLALIAYFFGQYLLYRAVLRKNGILEDEGVRIIGFALMAPILLVPIMIGANILWVPGIILAAKWIMAPTFIVAQPVGLFEAIGSSWKASENNTTTLSLAFTVMILIWFAAFAVAVVVFNGALLAYSSPASIVTISLLPVLLLGLSVTAYQQLAADDKHLGEIFE